MRTRTAVGDVTVHHFGVGVGRMDHRHDSSKQYTAEEKIMSQYPRMI